jgi:hypothetical protein
MTLDFTVRNPLRHVLRAYDRAIRACELEDGAAAHRALALLRASLDHGTAEASGFEGIFVWCERAVVAGDFAEPARRLGTLRNAWQTAEQVRPGTGRARLRGLRVTSASD